MSEHGSGLPLFNDLAGRRAIVTGGAHGIGEAIVLRLAEQGVEVLVVDKDQQALAARVVGRKGCVPIEADLAAGNPAILVETLCADFGTPDIIVNNEVFSPGFAVRGRLGKASLQVRPLCQRSVECRLPAACAEDPRPKSLTTR
jgi:NAD(P)-dependent dehydrogenase (short-subunit alcohol dehydrogenase family)